MITRPISMSAGGRLRPISVSGRVDAGLVRAGQAVLEELGDPCGIGYIGLASEQLAHVACVEQPGPEALLEGMLHRLPDRPHTRGIPHTYFDCSASTRPCITNIARTGLSARPPHSSHCRTN